jgi:hypothetical protein
MMMLKNPDYSPRLSVETTEDQFNSLKKLIPFGIKKQLFAAIVDDLIQKLEDAPRRDIIFAAIMSKMISLTESSLNLETRK